MPRRFLHRHAPPKGKRLSLNSGLGGILGGAILLLIHQISGAPFLLAPFAATCVLIFGAPDSPLAQPAAILGGHLVCATLGLILAAFLPPEWWVLALAVGASIFLMMILRVTHPPAGALTVVCFLTDHSAKTLLSAVAVGAVALISAGVLFHRLPPRKPYPLPIELETENGQRG